MEILVISPPFLITESENTKTVVVDNFAAGSLSCKNILQLPSDQIGLVLTRVDDSLIPSYLRIFHDTSSLPINLAEVKH